MNWVRQVSNMLTILDNWINESYFTAIDTIKTEEDVAYFKACEIQSSLFNYIDQYNENGLQPLHYAILARNQIAIDWILSHENVPINSRTENENRNSAHCAVITADSLTLTKLIHLDADLDDLDFLHLTPLAYAEDDLNAGEWLDKLELKPLNFKIYLGENKRNYFHFFARDSMPLLLDYAIKTKPEDININKADESGTTPLMLAVENDQLIATWTLMQNGASVVAIDSEGRSVLHRAAAANQANACRMILYDSRVLPADYQTTVDDFCQTEDDSFEKIRSMALQFVQDSQGLTPLMTAVMNKHVETVDALISNRHNSNFLDIAQPETGNTALHLAVQHNSFEIARSLLEAGAYIDAVNSEGKRPIDLAKETGRTEIYDLFVDA